MPKPTYDYYLELSTNLREVTQSPEKVFYRAFCFWFVNVKALVAAFNKEKASWASSVHFETLWRFIESSTTIS